MAWTTITTSRKDIDDELASFEGTVTSIDGFATAGHGYNQITALIEYTP
jgi:hypothetical protein